ncbi:DNA (cytosine-5-)-methyltransferase [Paracoccus sp. JM45]|uniref:DNA (cytosine-5-)-methyltransferase n=1 Tax=Paracoccus sp. JM45 TaxID=2283626 RepID=UPI000E6BC58B|nr:DNA (cytosine-5-)-methyltransferase [Paracoccus sp. JM45]RJE78530.1 DNA (cytosine-5-)-methyltransferase [Paracoccus sp. JM45]
MLDRMLNLGAWVQAKREGLGLTQKAFAELLGMPETGERTVRGWELGEHFPTVAKRAQIEILPDTALLRSPYSTDPDNADFTFIDLFAGIGGIRLPFQKQGGHCVFTSEWDKFAKKTYAANYGQIPHGDITKIAANDIPEHDVLLAGFPCQAFSQAGLRQGFNDTRGTMFFEIQRILAHHRPKAFLLENVKQLKGHDQGRTLKTILSILEGRAVPEIPDTVPMSEEARKSLRTKLNYRVGYRVLKAANFGVPQNRERVYIIGFDRDQISAANEADICTRILDRLSKVKCKTRVGDILENDASVDPKYTISDQLLAGHVRRLAGHKEKGNGFGYSVFTKDSPYTNTISARYYKDGSEILIDQSHIGKNPRKLTPRECARLQGFPENFNVDAVSNCQNYRQFGNSVSVPVIEAIAAEMKPYISG